MKAELGIKRKKTGKQWFWVFDGNKPAKAASHKVGNVGKDRKAAKPAKGAKVLPFPGVVLPS